MILPALPKQDLLTQLCTETATDERVAPTTVEKDFYLTRASWALADHFGDKLLLKGGTLLSKVDLGFHRMSEDIDLVLPLEGRPGSKGWNARAMNRVRDALKVLAPQIGVRLERPDGERSEKDAHVLWELPYPSSFGPQAILVEVGLRPVHRAARRMPLKQLLADPLVGGYGDAYCWALDAMEARAEKVRAACTREAGRDFYDLDLLLKSGADFKSDAFIALVDAKLAELKAPPLKELRPVFGLIDPRRQLVEASLERDLPAVVRLGEAPFRLEPMLRRFASLWSVY